MQKRTPMAEINLVPFIDVMLVLLIVFMITTPLLTQGVKVDLPRTGNAEKLSPDVAPAIVTLDRQGVLYLNLAASPGQPLTEQMLSHYARTLLKEQKRPFFIRGDRHVSYGQVMAVMAVLKSAGADKVGLLTAQGKEEKT